MKIAVICPDGLSTVLFCSEIIRSFKKLPDARVLVLTDVGDYGRALESLGAEPVQISMARFIDPARDVKYLWQLFGIFRRERFDVVFNVSTKPNIYGAIAARLAGVKMIVMNVLGLGVSFLPAEGMRDRIVQAIVRRLYRIALAWSDKIWLTNPGDLEILRQRRMIDEHKALVTPFWLDVDVYTPDAVSRSDIAAVRTELGLSPERRIVVMVARLIWPKGIREFAESAELLKERYPDTSFVLVAPHQPGSRDAVPDSYIREMERRANFRWLDFQRDVKRLYATCDLAVLPSYYKEGGYPRALTEPMAMGKPIVTTESPDCRETVEEGKNGYRVPIKDSRALAEAIGKLLGDADKRARFGEYSRIKAVRDFNERVNVPNGLRALGFPIPT